MERGGTMSWRSSDAIVFSKGVGVGNADFDDEEEKRVLMCDAAELRARRGERRGHMRKASDMLRMTRRRSVRSAGAGKAGKEHNKRVSVEEACSPSSYPLSMSPPPPALPPTLKGSIKGFCNL